MRRDPIGFFTHHPVAADLLMVLMILSGIAAVTQLNTQFFPTFSIDYININVAWRGATAEDIEQGITNVIEPELRDLDDVRRVTSVSAQGMSSIFIEYHQGTDLSAALSEVNEVMGRVRGLPATAEDPEIIVLENKELIARVLLAGNKTREELRLLAKQMERELLQRGITKVELSGLPEEEIAIQIPAETLADLGLPLHQIAAQIDARSLDLPAGEVGGGDVGRQLRGLEQRRAPGDFASLRITNRDGTQVLRLGDLAEIERRPRSGEVITRYQGKPAVEITLWRGKTENTLDAANILNAWLADTRPQLPQGVELIVYNEQWTLIKERIDMLLGNGVQGLVFIIVILFLTLNARVAFWVAWGIPSALLATLAVMYLFGGSINMVSLFALILTLGIIDDDAIVVGEDALAHYQGGEDPMRAAEGGARRMFWPVLASSLTTMAAFLPLTLVGGIIGTVMISIPQVVICVIIASLLECFLVLPAHLHRSFVKIRHAAPTGLRRVIDEGFDRFREQRFRRLVRWAIANRGATVAIAVAVVMLVLTLLSTGRVKFQFFPTPENSVIFANVTFAAGTPVERVDTFLDELERSLYATDAALGGGLVVSALTERGRAPVDDGAFNRYGDRYGSLRLELLPPDARQVRNPRFISEWQKRIRLPPGVENFEVYSPTGGPPGRDIELRLRGDDIHLLKAAAEELAAALRGYPGIHAVADDTPYGREQLVYRLTPQGEALGLTVSEVGRQLRAAYDGELVQVFQDLGDEIEVRVILPEAQRRTLASLDTLPIVLPGGATVPLSSVAVIEPRRGFETLRHRDGKLAIKVSGDVDETTSNANELIAQIDREVLPRLVDKYHVEVLYEGRAEDQAETLGDMKLGAWVGLVLIYVVLAWIFGSYVWPLPVMAIIPLGLAGAVFGHWVMGIDLTVVSLFGLFGLAGIVVNNSIILVSFYKELREQGVPVRQALEDASCLRLRAMILTSVTTIAGLSPLVAETSTQAQFLIPLAVSICFGLAIATLLVLVLVPALLGLYEAREGRLAATAPHRESAGT
ncbi:MAG TPA: efflux RND transporter permease subunit [Nevskiales bacterium]|nr:efflux RND transporter permease subunit [Nevskiales bacterium]